MTKHFPTGLDGRMRDEDGQIRHKRRDTHVGTIREELPNFAPGTRSDAELGTVLERDGSSTLHEYLKKHPDQH